VVNKSRIDFKLGSNKEFRTTEGWPFHVSCGGVVYRVNENQVEILILSRGKEMNVMLGRESKQTWHLPKGTLNHDESLIDGAIREVKEEAGVFVEVQAYLGSRIADWTEKGIHFIKDHHYFLMEYLSESEEGIDHEHESKSWFPIEKAQELLEWDKEAVETAKLALRRLEII